MRAIEHEISTQPASWRRARELAPDVASLLPATGERVAAVGCGTSWFMAQAYAGLREERGAGETDAFTATELPVSRRYDRVVIISRSGTTTEVERLIPRLRPPVTAITAVADSPVARAAGASIVLHFADERSVVQTRFATTVLALLRAHLGEDLGEVIADAERALTGQLPIDPRTFDHFVFLGRGWTIGLAHEAALKVREASAAFSESYPAMEYRHGPISLAGPHTLVWTLGDLDGDLRADVRRTQGTVLSSDLDPMAELIRIQRVAVALAEARGLDPDRPRHLTRSVVLS